jgi:hypothetical protein
MLHKLKKRLKEWSEEVQRREVARLHEQNMKLKVEIERETGRPIQLTPEERNRLAQISEGMDPETLEQISIFDPKAFMTADSEKDSAENT